MIDAPTKPAKAEQRLHRLTVTAVPGERLVIGDAVVELESRKSVKVHITAPASVRVVREFARKQPDVDASRLFERVSHSGEA